MPSLWSTFSPLSPQRPIENYCGSKESVYLALTAAGRYPDVDQVAKASRSPTVPYNVKGSVHTAGSPDVRSLELPSVRWWKLPHAGRGSPLRQRKWSKYECTIIFLISEKVIIVRLNSGPESDTDLDWRCSVTWQLPHSLCKKHVLYNQMLYDSNRQPVPTFLGRSH
jgi:hypothetical protein